jgi:hypothetical protein
VRVKVGTLLRRRDGRAIHRVLSITESGNYKTIALWHTKNRFIHHVTPEAVRDGRWIVVTDVTDYVTDFGEYGYGLSGCFYSVI